MLSVHVCLELAFRPLYLLVQLLLELGIAGHDVFFECLNALLILLFNCI